MFDMAWWLQSQKIHGHLFQTRATPPYHPRSIPDVWTWVNIFYLLFAKYKIDFLVCRIIAEEIDWDVSQVDPRKTLEVCRV